MEIVKKDKDIIICFQCEKGFNSHNSFEDGMALVSKSVTIGEHTMKADINDVINICPLCLDNQNNEWTKVFPGEAYFKTKEELLVLLKEVGISNDLIVDLTGEVDE